MCVSLCAQTENRPNSIWCLSKSTYLKGFVDTSFPRSWSKWKVAPICANLALEFRCTYAIHINYHVAEIDFFFHALVTWAFDARKKHHQSQKYFFCLFKFMNDVLLVLLPASKNPRLYFILLFIRRLYAVTIENSPV